MTSNFVNLKYYKLSKDNTLIPFADYCPVKHATKPKYLDKNTFDHFHITLNYNRKDFASIGVGSKTFERNYKYHYPNRVDRARFAGNKISVSQKRINSNHKNTGKPRKLLDKELLIIDIQEHKTISYLCLKYKVSEPTVLANIKYHNIEKEYRDVGILKLPNYYAYKSLELLLNRPLIEELKNAKKDLNYIENFVVESERHLRVCREACAYLRSRYSFGASRSPNSRFERYVMEFLDDREIVYIPQYRLGGFVFDIYIPELNLVVECDGFLHTKDVDDKKDIAAKENNLILVRILFNNIKNNSKRLCLQEIELCLYRYLQ